ncbi:hypothetical protein JCM6882_001754 [Rhodosporidiobolus microsporus]
MPRRTSLVYAVLVLLRIFVAFTSTSLIHPDEHFQNPEVAAATVFDYSGGDGPLKTWEWTSSAPCRSILPVFGSSGLAFAALRQLLGPSPSARALFVAERTIMLLFSFALDYLIHLTSKCRTAVVLFASSPVTFTFLLRPFSNSLETLALACLFASTSTKDLFGSSHAPRLALGAVLAIGVFIRVTFAAFAAPLLLAFAWRLGFSTPDTGAFRRSILLRRGSLIALSFFLTASLLALCDWIYFDLDLDLEILTPLNLLRYNLSSDNLAEHGLHPRYLHLVANWPMLFGVGLAILWCALRGGGASGEGNGGVWGRRVYLASFVVPTLLLSIQPHQEPRFLVPLIVPLALLAPYAPFLASSRPSAKAPRRIFWTLWLVHSLLFTALFGYLHQGGVLPSLFAINNALRDPESALGAKAGVDIVFWRTFMPPRHLLVPPSSDLVTPPAVRVVDLAGAPLAEFFSTLSVSLSASSAYPSSATFLVAPAYAVDALSLACDSSDLLQPSAPVQSSQAARNEFCLQPSFGGRTFGVHVDMDRLDDLFKAQGWGRTGVGVWQVEEKKKRA